jgi:tRNA (guanine9-N1)-methyltransferase
LLITQARAAELRPLKRQAEKLRRQERSKELAAGYANGTLSEADKEVFELRKAKEKERRSARKESKILRDDGESGEVKGKGKDVWGGAVIMDLGFDELMTDQVS